MIPTLSEVEMSELPRQMIEKEIKSLREAGTK